ncbi:MFS transporter [Candidatus Uhrbacteria bacterium]|nr:MFS transporter [Candidatus Uhrbacteria bacterium]
MNGDPRFLIFLLASLNLLNYLDQYLIAPFGPSIQRTLGLNDAQLGFVGSAYLWGFLLSSLLIGQIAKRMTRKSILVASLAIWGLATALCGWLPGLVLLIVMRAIMGLGQAAFTAIAPTIIDDEVEPAKKGRALSFFYAAVPVGTALGFILGGLMNKAVGWHLGFVVAGLASLMLLPWLFALHVEESKTKEAKKSFWRDISELWKAKRYVFGVAGYAAQTFAVAGFAFWAPSFLLRKFSYPTVEGSLIFGIILVATGFIGTLGGGWLFDRWPGKDRVRIALELSTLATLASIPFAVLGVMTGTAAVFFVSMAVVQTAVFMTFSPINAVFLESVPISIRNSAMGMSMFIGRALGDTISIWLVGSLSDRWHNLTFAMLILPAALVVNAALWFIAFKCRCRELK